MGMRFMLIIFVVFLSGFQNIVYAQEVKIPNAILANKLPDLSDGINSTPIDNNFKDMDPSIVLGSVIYKPDRRVTTLTNFLKQGTKLKVEAKTEVRFRNLVENSLVLAASWLSFLTTKVGVSSKAEVSIIKILTASLTNDQIDLTKIEAFSKSLPSPSVRRHYAIIMGYHCWQCSATLFKEASAEAGFNGYGAKIDGKWFNKSENTEAYPYIMALWSDLPYIYDIVKERKEVKMKKEVKPIDLVQLVKDGIKSGKIKVEPIESLTMEVK